jgi:tricorn protease
VRPILRLALAALLAPVLAFAAPSDEGLTRLLRYPTVSKDRIAFVYAGDVWTAPIEGGAAHRLTSDPGEEIFPRFSPDGKRIAFTGEMSGTPQVWVVPADGGPARQLTFHNDVGVMPPRGGVDNQVLGWTPDGSKVLFTAHRVPWSERLGRPYLVPASGGYEEPMAIAKGAGGGFSPDGKRYVFTPNMREFRTWKRYRGGNVQDIWIFDLEKKTAKRIIHDASTNNQPMWIGDTIYFTSDRGAKMKLNLWACDLATGAVRQVTHHEDWDVLWPSAGAGSIVYECGGWIWRYDVASGKSARVPIRVSGDFPQAEPYFKNVKGDIASADISPTGKRAVFEARGEIFTVPAKEGEIRNVTSSAGVRETSPAWSPDGQWIAYLSDRTGEYEIWLRRSDGSGEERRVTRDGDVWRFPPLWSPDSKKLAFADKKERLRWVDVASGRVTDVDRGTYSDITDYRWSPDSRWIAYPKETLETKLPAIWVYSLEQGKTYRLTSGWAADGEPVFDPTGRYLYFLSNRDFHLTFSAFEFNYVYTDATRVYVGVLSKKGPALFLPKSDEEEIHLAADELKGREKPAKGGQGMQVEKKAAPEGEKKSEPANAAAGGAGPVRVDIDVDGFESRVRAIPVSAGNYSTLSATAKGVLYVSGTAPKTKLSFYDVEEKKEHTILDGVDNYALSADGSRVLFHHGENYGIAEVKPDQKPSEGLLALGKLEMRIEPRQEWAQEFTDAWRIMRDWYYDPGMNGVDWNAVRQRYGELVPFVADRNDLDFLFGEIAGEVGSGHTYVSPSADTRRKRVEGGLLGAEIEPDPSGYWRVAKIFPGENWQDDFRSPLTEPGIDVRAGDLILAVDGVPTKGVDNFYRLLDNKADRIVTLLVNERPSPAGAREERVKPVKSEQNLRYLDWVASRRAWVEKASGGRIGYIHLPDTAVAGNRELFKAFYPQTGKDALVLDDRYNGGGFIPDRMIELLNRPLLNRWVRRGLEPITTPSFVVPGPKVCLINHMSASDGDLFPYFFRKYGLGPLIGTRTWGGEIWLSSSNFLVDRGIATAAEFGVYGPEGRWLIEGHGVDPDTVVDNLPHSTYNGADAQLQAAISYLQRQIRDHPLPVPPAPAYPKKGGP